MRKYKGLSSGAKCRLSLCNTIITYNNTQILPPDGIHFFWVGNTKTRQILGSRLLSAQLPNLAFGVSLAYFCAICIFCGVE